jgi:methylated-DNA-[protein]-cysteine S-methyltransferase
VTATNPLVAGTMRSPVGELTLVAGDRGLVAILWENDPPHRVPLGTLGAHAAHPVIDQAAAELTAYFAGERTSFAVPLDFRGTSFQRQVWAELLAIPYGETRSYGEIARRLGCPGASRAVGAANGRNPISIIAPCHRVIGASGKLTGFAGGLAAKQWLLRHEQGSATLPLFTG